MAHSAAAAGRMACPPADEFPNYPAGSWGPWAAHDLIHRDGRSWFEVVNRETLERSAVVLRRRSAVS